MTDALVEAVARGIAKNSYPGFSEADIEEMWDGYEGDAAAALQAIEAAGYRVVPVEQEQ